jgi:hypothetical protein
MTLHVDHSTVAHDTSLISVAESARDGASRAARTAEKAVSGNGVDSAAISAQGQRLAALGDAQPRELDNYADAEALVRTMLTRLAGEPKAAAVGQSGLDPARVAALLA